MEHTAVLTLDEQDVRDRLIQLNSYFRENRASFYYDSLNALHSIDLFWQLAEEDATEAAHAEADFADSITQLLIFSFEGAPSPVIDRWGESHGNGLGKKALKFVEIVRTEFSAGKAEWDRRRDAPGKMFGDVELSVVLSPGVDGATVQLHANAFEPTGSRLGPQGSSRTHFYTRLTHSELRRVIAKMQSLDRIISEVEAAADE